jgi:hypothetical protein
LTWINGLCGFDWVMPSAKQRNGTTRLSSLADHDGRIADATVQEFARQLAGHLGHIHVYDQTIGYEASNCRLPACPHSNQRITSIIETVHAIQRKKSGFSLRPLFGFQSEPNLAGAIAVTSS